MKKTGRPAENPQSPIEKVISVRLSSDDIVKLDECAQALDVSKGKIIRMGIEKIHAELKSE